jgi:hypothetical protein
MPRSLRGACAAGSCLEGLGAETTAKTGYPKAGLLFKEEEGMSPLVFFGARAFPASLLRADKAPGKQREELINPSARGRFSLK